MGKISRKLQYWCSLFLCLAARAVVVNSVLLSTLWYFFAIWGGSTIVVKRIKTKLNNYLWKGKDQRARIRVNWRDCSVPRQQGGLSLIDPEVALQALLAKWIVKALLPGTSHLQLLLRHQLLQIRPQAPGQWTASLRWCLTPKFRAHHNSPVWNRTVRVWKGLTKHLVGVPPTNFEEVLQTSPWWATSYIGNNFGFSAPRSAELVQLGLCNIGSLWSREFSRFWIWDELHIRYGLPATEKRRILAIIAAIPSEWLQLLQAGLFATQPSEHIGIYAGQTDVQPTIILATTRHIHPRLGPWVCCI
jgi:hypothetical protein